MLYIRFLLALGNISDAWKVLKSVWKGARSRALATRLPNGIKLPIRTWGQRFWASLISMLMLQEVVDFFTAIVSKGFGLGVLGFMKVAPDHAADVVEWAANQIISFEPLASRLAAVTISQITGVDINSENIKHVVSDDHGRHRAVELGGQFMRVVTSIFSVDAARKDFETRTGNSGSETNLASYFGTNLFFQLRSLTISTVASLTGWHTLRHLEQLHQSVNWAFGFGWLSWAVMSEYMNVTINPGLRRSLNAQVRPNDYSEVEARWAWWAGFINSEDLLRIMDNQGVRIDIRDALLNKAEADMPESEMYDLWQHGRLTEDKYRQRIRVKGFGEISTDLKIEAVKDKRLWSWLDKISDKYLQLYRDGVIGGDEVRQWLQSQGWTDNEIAAAEAYQDLDRRTRHFLSFTELMDAYAVGLMGFDEVYEQLLDQGYTDADAFIAMMLKSVEKLPKDCMDKIKPGDQAQIINAVLASIFGKGVLTVPSGMLKLAQCLGSYPFPLFTAPGEDGKTPALHLPTGSFNATPSSPVKGDRYRLMWSIERADTVEIDNGIGKVQNEGVLFLIADTDQVWHLTATNEDGVKHLQASLLVKPKPSEKPVKAPAPQVSLSISPTSIVEGEQYTIIWSAANVDQVFLDDGNGAVPVGLNGARIAVADHNRIFTLTGAGPGGQRSRSDALIVRPPAQDTVKNPSASLAISPGQAVAGSEIEIRWSTSNADSITIEGVALPGPIGPVGAAIVTADHDRIISLTASNTTTGVARQSIDASIVTAPPSTAPTTDPKPTASLTIRPSTTTPGSKLAVEWRTANADHVTLDTGAGAHGVDPIGALEMTATKDGLFVLHAKGPGGETAVVKVLLVTAKEDKPKAPAKPTATLTVRPTKAKPGDPVALEWRVTNATKATLSINGAEQEVSLVDTALLTAVETAEIRLVARGPGGEVALAKVLIVE